MTSSDQYWYSIALQKSNNETIITIHDDLGTYTENYSLTWHAAAVQRINELKEAGFILHLPTPKED